MLGGCGAGDHGRGKGIFFRKEQQGWGCAKQRSVSCWQAGLKEGRVCFLPSFFSLPLVSGGMECSPPPLLETSCPGALLKMAPGQRQEEGGEGTQVLPQRRQWLCLVPGPRSLVPGRTAPSARVGGGVLPQKADGGSFGRGGYEGVQTESETAHVQEILPPSRVHRADRGCGQDGAKRKTGWGQESRYAVWWRRGVKGGTTETASSAQCKTGMGRAQVGC